MTGIETVLGPISPQELGVTLMHEHLLNDIRLEGTAKRKREAKKNSVLVKSENLWILRWDPLIAQDNLVILDENMLTNELNLFANDSGTSLVDLSCIGLHRDINGMKRLSRRTGVNVICSTGFYLHLFHPSYVHKKSVEELKDIMVNEITIEIEGSDGIKAGVIGECGCSRPIPFHPDERKVLVAAARAQALTKAPLTIHPSSGDWTIEPDSITEAMSYVDLLQREGADLSKFYLSHADSTCGKIRYHQRLLDRGITLCYDNFGKDYYYSMNRVKLQRTDKERILAIAHLCKEGYDKQLLLSHDVCLKTDLRTYGGFGYSHILSHIVPCLKEEGVPERAIRNMLVNNPRRLLSR
jgi:phosphotriesterase-related protein